MNFKEISQTPMGSLSPILFIIIFVKLDLISLILNKVHDNLLLFFLE